MNVTTRPGDGRVAGKTSFDEAVPAYVLFIGIADGCPYMDIYLGVRGDCSATEWRWCCSRGKGSSAEGHGGLDGRVEAGRAVGVRADWGGGDAAIRPFPSAPRRP
jgi:hypothetical protein